MWLLLLLLAGLGLSSPLPRADSADLVLVAGDGEMSDLMRTAITMMEDRVDRDVEQVSILTTRQLYNANACRHSCVSGAEDSEVKVLLPENQEAALHLEVADSVLQLL